MGVCDVPVISTVCDAAGEDAATFVSAPFDWLASTMGQAAGWLIEAMWKVFDTTTTTTLVDVTADGYLDVYNLVFGIGVFIVLPSRPLARHGCWSDSRLRPSPQRRCRCVGWHEVKTGLEARYALGDVRSTPRRVAKACSFSASSIWMQTLASRPPASSRIR